MKIKVLEDTCIGCGACAAIASDVFDLNDDGMAVAKLSEVTDEKVIEEAKDAAEGCPVSAIVCE